MASDGQAGNEIASSTPHSLGIANYYRELSSRAHLSEEQRDEQTKTFSPSCTSMLNNRAFIKSSQIFIQAVIYISEKHRLIAAFFRFLLANDPQTRYNERSENPRKNIAGAEVIFFVSVTRPELIHFREFGVDFPSVENSNQEFRFTLGRADSYIISNRKLSKAIDLIIINKLIH